MASKEASPFLSNDGSQSPGVTAPNRLQILRGHGGTPADTDSPKDANLGESASGPLQERRRDSTWLFARLEKSWLYESIGVLLSAAALASMTATLVRQNEQRLPDWGWVSFSALISILSTISKMAALYSATSALSQMKWIWFAEHNHNLSDFTTFDRGSRGSIGAIFLLWKLRAW